jgi:hypothetical protein
MYRFYMTVLLMIVLVQPIFTNSIDNCMHDIVTMYYQLASNPDQISLGSPLGRRMVQLMQAWSVQQPPHALDNAQRDEIHAVMEHLLIALGGGSRVALPPELQKLFERIFSELAIGGMSADVQNMQT